MHVHDVRIHFLTQLRRCMPTRVCMHPTMFMRTIISLCLLNINYIRHHTGPPWHRAQLAQAGISAELKKRVIMSAQHTRTTAGVPLKQATAQHLHFAH